jgi:hypothetical protein
MGAPKDVNSGEFAARCVERFAQEAPDEEWTMVIGSWGATTLTCFKNWLRGLNSAGDGRRPDAVSSPAWSNGGGGHEYEDNFDSGGKA